MGLICKRSSASSRMIFPIAMRGEVKDSSWERRKKKKKKRVKSESRSSEASYLTFFNYKLRKLRRKESIRIREIRVHGSRPFWKKRDLEDEFLIGGEDYDVELVRHFGKM